MKNGKIGPILKWSSLGSVFVSSLAAMFLPYHIEWLFAFLCVGLALFGLALFLRKNNYPKWRLLAEACISFLAFLFALLFIFLKVYAFYFLTQAFALILVLLSLAISFISLRKREKRAGFARYFALISTFILVLVVFSFVSVSLLGFGRSSMATGSEIVTAMAKTDDEHAKDAFLKDTAKPIETNLDTSLVRRDVRMELFEGMKVYYINGNADYDNVLFYIHGGYYIYDIGAAQISFCDKIASSSNAMVVVPLYGLAPYETVSVNYPRMMNLFQKVTKRNPGKKISLMGDSAGGGFALALAEGFSAQPDELILVSPWVDVTMGNPEAKDAFDPVLTITMSKLCGEAWADQTYPIDDWHVSPIFGDLSKLGPVTIFVGSRELFYPDDTLLYRKIVDSGNPNATLHVGKGMNHTYPFYPSLEGRIAFEGICQIVKR